MRVGIDLGGTKIAAIALDDSGVCLQHLRIATPRCSGAVQEVADIVQAVASLVKQLEQTFGAVNSVGIGTPGSLNPKTGLLKNSNTVSLNGTPLKMLLENALGRTIRMENDANCLALSEYTDGAGKHADSLFAVILGTGVGGGLVVNGQLISGAHGIGGEWGHNPLPWMSDEERNSVSQCYCGQHGCIETFLSGSGLVNMYQNLLGRLGSNDNSGAKNRIGLTAYDIANKIENDKTAQQALLKYCDTLARGLASVINVIDPEVIVLGGGLSNIDTIYEELPRRIQPYVFCENYKLTLLKSEHGDDSGVRGAANLSPIV